MKKPKTLLQDKPLKVLTGIDNPKLRMVAKEIKDPTAPEYEFLAARMIATIKHVGAVGIAAPQVGVSRRMIVISSKPTGAYPDAPIMESTPILNPRLVRRSQGVKSNWEGCASIPGVRAKVVRYNWVEVEYTGLDGKVQLVAYDGFLARIFQHEYDHLDGILFVDGAEMHTRMNEDDYLLMVDEARARKRKRVES